MRIEVKNNDPMKAYKILMKKLNKENFFKELRNKKFFRTKQEKKKEALHAAILREKKATILRDKEREKEEKWIMIESKKRSREAKRNKKRGPN